MRYRAPIRPAFMARHFTHGVTADTLARAPSLVFNPTDELQARWARRLCHRHVELPRHTLPWPQAFVTATLAGMGWGMQLEVMVAPYLKDGTLVELVPGICASRTRTGCRSTSTSIVSPSRIAATGPESSACAKLATANKIAKMNARVKAERPPIDIIDISRWRFLFPHKTIYYRSRPNLGNCRFAE